MRFRGRAPLTTLRVKVRRYAPIVGRAKSAVRQRKLGQSVRAEEVRSAKSVNLMKHVPNAMQEVTDDEQGWYSETNKPENSKQNHSHRFESPCFFVREIGGEREVKCRDCDEKQGKKICCAFAENNFCEMKMDRAAGRIPTHTYRTMITDSAI